MGNFRSDNRAREFGGRSRGGFGRDRDSRMSERRPREMHEVTCDKCGKQCRVPFRPSGGKPVFCSDCFRNEGSSGSSFRPSSRDNSYSRGNSSSLGNSSSSGISQEQYKEINTKLNKILGILETIEFEDEDSEDESEDEESEE